MLGTRYSYVLQQTAHLLFQWYHLVSSTAVSQGAEISVELITPTTISEFLALGATDKTRHSGISASLHSGSYVYQTQQWCHFRLNPLSTVIPSTVHGAKRSPHEADTGTDPGDLLGNAGLKWLRRFIDSTNSKSQGPAIPLGNVKGTRLM